MNAMHHARPDTPVSGIPHSMICQIKGAKIVDAIKPGIEMTTGGSLPDEEINRIVDPLLSRDVYSFFLCY